MKIEKVIKSRIERNYFFIKGQLDDIDVDYFIKRIEEGIKSKDNLNFQTNVYAKSTPFTFFCTDELFLKIICKLIDYVDNNKITQRGYCLQDAWGIKEEFGHYSQEHNHLPNYMSGVIYLNKHDHKLYFPQIKEEITPERGNFVLFSSFLDHYTTRNLGENRYCISFNFRYRTISESTT